MTRVNSNDNNFIPAAQRAYRGLTPNGKRVLKAALVGAAVLLSGRVVIGTLRGNRHNHHNQHHSSHAAATRIEGHGQQWQQQRHSRLHRNDESPQQIMDAVAAAAVVEAEPISFSAPQYASTGIDSSGSRSRGTYTRPTPPSLAQTLQLLRNSHDRGERTTTTTMSSATRSGAGAASIRYRRGGGRGLIKVITWQTKLR